MTLAKIDIDPAIVERVLLHGDLRELTPAQKVSYYARVCEVVGLNPLTQPFQYLVLNGREVLYARRECTEQLRHNNDVSIQITARELLDDVFVVTARATLPTGRTDESIGAVPIAGLKGEARANALMKAETKSKRRVTLAICGLGMLDETEVESLPPEATHPQPPPGPGKPWKNFDGPMADPPPLEPAPAIDEPPADADRPQPLYVESVVASATRKPNVTKYSIQLSSGLTVTTISDWMGSLADQMKADRIPVVIKVRETKWGSDLLALKRADVPDLPLEPPPTDDEIPF